jgi:hypothetical protein
MKDRDEIEVSRQVRFGENGEMEADEETDTDLSDWGIVEEEVERPTKYEVEEASEFGVDDRNLRSDGGEPGEQEELFIEAAEGQMDLTGSEAGRRSNW